MFVSLFVILGGNPCDSNPCQNGGKCFPSQDKMSFTCQCPEECTGDICQNCDRKYWFVRLFIYFFGGGKERGEGGRGGRKKTR